MDTSTIRADSAAQELGWNSTGYGLEDFVQLIRDVVHEDLMEQHRDDQGVLDPDADEAADGMLGQSDDPPPPPPVPPVDAQGTLNLWVHVGMHSMWWWAVWWVPPTNRWWDARACYTFVYVLTRKQKGSLAPSLIYSSTIQIHTAPTLAVLIILLVAHLPSPFLCQLYRYASI